MQVAIKITVGKEFQTLSLLILCIEDYHGLSTAKGITENIHPQDHEWQV